MKSSKKTFVVVMILVLLLAGACQSDPTLAPRNIRPDDDSTGESSSDSTDEKGTEGSATLSYTYKIEDRKGKRTNLVQVDVPLDISPNPDDDKKYIVSGFAQATAYTQQGSGEPTCWVHCDLPAEYRFDGNVIQTPIDEEGNCIISLEVWTKIDSVKAYGDCPELVVSQYPCDRHKGDYDDGYEYIFSSYAPSYSPETGDKRVTITAVISDVKIPPAIKDTCRWGE